MVTGENNQYQTIVSINQEGHDTVSNKTSALRRTKIIKFKNKNEEPKV